MALAVFAVGQSAGLEAAIAALRRGDWGRAATLTTAYLGAHRDSAAGWNLAGLIADHDGDYAAAQSDYEKALRFAAPSGVREQIEHNLGNHDLLLGQSRLAAHDCAAAVQLLRAGWRANGGDRARLALGEAEFCAGAAEQAAATGDFAALWQSEPRWWQPPYYLGRLAAGAGDVAGATRSLVAAEALAGGGEGAAPVAAALGSLCMRQGFWLDARDEWQKFERLRPEDATGERELAISAEIGGDDHLAETAMERYVAAEPRDANGHFLLALIEKNRGELAAAGQELAEAVRLDPRLAPAWTAAGQMRLDAGDLAGAAASLRQALRADPRDAQALTAMAECLARLNQPRQAIPLLERALAVAPNDLAALYQLSQLYERTGQAAQARAIEARFERARQAPRAARGGRGLLAYFRADVRLDPAEQRQHYLRFLRTALLAGREPAAAARLEARLGVAEWQAGERAAARRDLAASLAAPAASLPGAEALATGEGLAAAGGARESLAFYDRAQAASRASDPPDARAALGKARALAALGRRGEALAVLAAVPATATPSGRAADLYGVLAAASGQDRVAAAAFRLALAEAPGDAGICRDAALFLASRGQWQPALDVLAAGIERQPHEEALRLERAILLQLANRRAEAQADLRALAAHVGDPQMSGDETLAAVLLGISYYTTDRAAKAAALFRQLSQRPNLAPRVAALVWYYRALLDQADGRRALAWCDKSLRLDSRYAPALYLRAELLERHQDAAGALAAARAAIAAEPDWSAPRYLAARLLRRAGQTAAAAAQMKEVAALQNGSPRSQLSDLLTALELP